MKQEENLTATNQLIRFIRGGVSCEEFYSQYPEVKSEEKPGRRLLMMGFLALAGVGLILVGYVLLSWQLRADRARLELLSKELEQTAAQLSSPQALEARKSFWSGQEALVRDLLGEKLSLSCLLKELSHLSPATVFFNRISLQSASSAAIQLGTSSKIGASSQTEDSRRKLVLEGMSVQESASYPGGDFPAFLARLNQSSFFRHVQVNYQREADTDYGRGLSFSLIADLR
ncbi:MAG: hypothetical protein K6U11_10180 [bacterium]|nr:hypothetical protein [bacterium]